MNETEYLNVSNRARITAALQIMGNVIQNHDVSQEEISAITSKLCELQDRLFKLIEVTA